MTGKCAPEATSPSRAGGWMREVGISYGCLALWIATSAAVIVYNKYILANLNFPFPITLAMLHMALSATLAHAAVGLGLVEKPDMPWHTYWRAVLPIGILYSMILSLSNATYMFLSVSFIQMLKALTPASVYAVGCLFGTEQWSWRLALNLLVVIVGVLISAYGEVQFVVVGVVAQVAAILLESVRLTLTQLLLQRQGIRLNPITALYYIAPCCLAGLLPPVFAIELERMLTSTIPAPTAHLLGNSAAAFALNLSSFLLLGRTSALTMNIGGVVKDWLLIGLSASIFHSVVTAVNLGGYGLAFAGVFWYNLQKIWARAGAEAAADAAAKPPDQAPLLKQPSSGASPRRSAVQEALTQSQDGREKSEEDV
eukprot:jgi/Ulvmu1/9756/UM055_0096.1